ncbi:MAG: phage tail tape measure protein, partial [Aristaeellaceae bacterium]
MDFTKVMINLGNSTDMVANDAATSIARFANIMGMSADQYENLGSTLVALGNNYATTESEIMEMSLRLAGAGKQVGLSEAQVLAFSAALSAVGIEAQMGGSSLSKALIKMEVAAATGGQALTDFATVCGMTEEQFKVLWAADPAAVFQSFITGLAQMDDAGISAIAVLDEIGISEIRLRDTLLRATNATELFSNTQNTANAAWKSGTELATVAEQRYATTASKLTNLKNSALLFAQTIGDDLNPTVQKLIEGAGEVIDRLMALDSTQRMQIIRWAAIAAAIGPVILVTGKVTKAIGTVSKGLGTFATAVGKAGGGFKGFMSVLTKSPAFWFAVAAATIAATAAIIDYASGAKQAREALEGMEKTAEDWKNTAADTFYGRSNGGLSFFGMSTDDFKKESAHSIQAANDWYAGLIAVWTDGKRETNAIVREWTDSWMQLTADTREGLAGLKENADANGYTGLSAQIQADMDTLDAMDREIAALLKKRQSKYFTEEDQRRLQELIAARGDIEIKYHLVEADAGGFDTIRDKMAAEVARAQARGQSDADVTVYQNAIAAAGQGMAAVNAQIDAQYDKEYALIQLIEDSTERQAAMDDLNARYLEQRRQAVQEYGETLAGFVMPVWNSESMQTAGDQMDRLVQLMRQYSSADAADQPGILTQMEALTSEMDEGTLAEYYGLLTQIQSLLDSGMSEAEVQALFPEIDFSSALEQLASIQTFLSTRQTELPGLASMFGEALPEEVLTIATDLDLTGAQARWAEFAANPG